MIRGAALAALLAAAGCARALHEPPPVAALAPAGAAPSGGAPAGGAPPAGGATALLEQARLAWAQRPDVAAVRRAESLFIQAADVDPAAIDGLIGAIEVKGWLVQHEKNAGVRTSLAESAVQAGQWCERRAPGRAECDYGLAVGLGMQVRERPMTANEGLRLMMERLRRAQKNAPRLDHGGPHRVMALLLLRAPGWPSGPGDAEAGLAEAQAATALFPDFPPNLLVLSEACQATGASDEARRTAERALELARQQAAAGDRDAPDQIAEAEALLAGMR